MDLEGFSTPLKLNPDGSAVLEELRRTSEPTIVFGMEPKAAEKVLRETVDPILRDAGLPWNKVDHYRWYVKDLARVFCRNCGPDLAFHIELLLRKWTGYGLEINSMQIILHEVYNKVRQPVAEETDQHEAGQGPKA
jgi:hypothetical protein